MRKNQVMKFGLKVFLAAMLGSLAIFTGLIYYSVTYIMNTLPTYEAEKGKTVF